MLYRFNAKKRKKEVNFQHREREKKCNMLFGLSCFHFTMLSSYLLFALLSSVGSMLSHCWVELWLRKIESICFFFQSFVVCSYDDYVQIAFILVCYSWYVLVGFTYDQRQPNWQLCLVASGWLFVMHLMGIGLGLRVRFMSMRYCNIHLTSLKLMSLRQNYATGFLFENSH